MGVGGLRRGDRGTINQEPPPFAALPNAEGIDPPPSQPLCGSERGLGGGGVGGVRVC